MLRREQYVCARRHALEHGAHIDAADGAKVVERRRAGLRQRLASRFDGYDVE
jgi:ribosomal protein L34